jgi:hypothetical protein
MQHANRTGRNRGVAVAAAKPEQQDNGRHQMAVLSLAGLAYTLILMAQDIGPNALQLMLTR